METYQLKEVPIGKVIEVIEYDQDKGYHIPTGRFYRLERWNSVGRYGKMPFQSRLYSLIGDLLCRIVAEPIPGL